MTESEQLSLVRSQLRRTSPRPPAGAAGAAEEAEELPVARVLVDTPLAHLDRPFDYLVTADQADAAVPGCRVRVRFAGKEVAGFVVQRVADSDHTGRLTPLRRVVSPQPVLIPQVARLCREVAERYAGSTSDVLRLAVPKRHARVEQEPAAQADAEDPPAAIGDAALAEDAPADDAWRAFPGGTELVRALREGATPRAVWAACPGVSWEQALQQAAAATVGSGRGVLVCVPDARDVARVSTAMAAGGLAARTVTLTADLGPAARYRAFLRILRADAPVVVGTRAAVFAPVRRLGLAVVWDDGDDLHAEPRAPYPHAREVLALRAHLERAALLVGGFAQTAEGAALVESGWARSLEPSRALVRDRAPRIHLAGESDRERSRDPAAAGGARLPHRAFEVARAALAVGPVLVQVPRAGYLPVLSCVRCRLPARCTHCHGPLALGPGQRAARCRWCGRAATGWRCEHCSADRFRAPVVGSRRTAEELGRSFPSVPVVSSVAGRVHDRVPGGPALVVCTPGAEPVAADGGYAAALLLDSWLALARPGLRTAEESLRRWFNAAALVRPAADGGRVVVVGDPSTPTLQALVRWDPAGSAARELAERASAHLPPAARLAVLSGPSADLSAALEELRMPAGAEVLGPMPDETGRGGEDDAAQVVARVPRNRGAALSAALKELQATRSAAKRPHLRVQVDPVELG